MTKQPIRILLLATESDFTNILYHKLSEEVRIEAVVIEEPVSKITLLKRRLRKLGLLKVIAQLLFIPTAFLLKRISDKRKHQILQEYHLSVESIPPEIVTKVSSINCEKVIQLIAHFSPELILVSGTRIISDNILRSSHVPFINIHAGITPLYRGVHGGYWALAMKDAEHCGVSVHLVDKGIDTGRVLAQSKIIITGKDNFVTYPYLQLAKGIELLSTILKEYQKNKTLVTKESARGESKLWSHPGLFEYLFFRWKRGVK